MNDKVKAIHRAMMDIPEGMLMQAAEEIQSSREIEPSFWGTIYDYLEKLKIKKEEDYVKLSLAVAQLDPQVFKLKFSYFKELIQEEIAHRKAKERVN